MKIPGFGKIVKARIRTDGVLTVGQPETVRVAKMPPKIRFDITIAPAMGAAGCDLEENPCEANVGSAPGTPAFRTSGKGRAQVTFVVPATYNVVSLKQPFGSQPASFVNGQSVGVGAVAFRTRHHNTTIALASASAVIEVPAPPTP